MISKLKKLGAYYRTLRHVKLLQIRYQVWYRLKKILSRRPSVKHFPVKVSRLVLQPSISSEVSLNRNCFNFLNKKKCFDKTIDWNFGSYGDLWAFNLNYFDFLNQPGIDNAEALEVMESYFESDAQLEVGLEPYPISLRGINWIKFSIYRGELNPKLNSMLHAHYRVLLKNLEYQHLANHLLENGFSLLFAAYYFDEPIFENAAIRILNHELREQTLTDGAHFELSPMYHQIVLFRLFDCINLVANNPRSTSSLLPLMLETAGKMIGWLKMVTFSNGDIPLVNDASIGIAPTSSALLAYATRLQVPVITQPLSDSGYRMIRFPTWELFVDVGNIGPDYNLAHAHSDTFNFILHYREEPIIIETGTSTYEKNDLRQLQRSTSSHNTVVVEGVDQSEVWSGFRVARRAKVTSLKEDEQSISAEHDGYRFLGVRHQRSWKYSNKAIHIIDELHGTNKIAHAYLHFHPNVQPILANGQLVIGPIRITFKNVSSIDMGNYQYAKGFNVLETASVLSIKFSHRLETSIIFNE